VRETARVGPRGSGKGTTAGRMRACLEARGLSVAVVKLAAPLYRLQSMFYTEAGIPLAPAAQDQCLLESVATHLRRIHPHALVNRFLASLSELKVHALINDDLRDDAVDWPALRQAGFATVKLATQPALRQQRLTGRQDPSVVHDSPLDAQMARIRPDFVLTNNGNLADLRIQVDGLCERLLLQAGETRQRAAAP